MVRIVHGKDADGRTIYAGDSIIEAASVKGVKRIIVWEAVDGALTRTTLEPETRVVADLYLPEEHNAD